MYAVYMVTRYSKRYVHGGFATVHDAQEWLASVGNPSYYVIDVDVPKAHWLMEY